MMPVTVLLIQVLWYINAVQFKGLLAWREYLIPRINGTVDFMVFYYTSSHITLDYHRPVYLEPVPVLL